MHTFDPLPRIAIIGLGYVGLPLAVAFSRHFPTLGFDTHAKRISELQSGRDNTLELSDTELAEAGDLEYSCDETSLKSATVYIVTVPTPIGKNHRPNLSALKDASAIIGRAISPGNTVIYESTVYPGATEEDCVPIIEAVSGLRFNQDFFAGYSPERINPGDKEHRLANIMKVTSGSTPEATEFVDQLYRTIVTAGTHRVDDMRVAEAAKVIENTQRDLNIALINELVIIFERLGIDTEAVLKAAGTKWNFLPFKPGLVGGHCIGVDPYYLTYKAETTGYRPEVILAGRRINDNMGSYVTGRLIKGMLKRRIPVNDARVLVMGFTFKENCPDTRNTRVLEIVQELDDYGVDVSVYDPWVSPQDMQRHYGITPIGYPETGHYDAVVLAVGHGEFAEMGVDTLRSFGKARHLLFDLRYLLPADQSDMRL